jgi:predicted TIM-barrel fold metal-dependent hydrolase
VNRRQLISGGAAFAFGVAATPLTSERAAAEAAAAPHRIDVHHHIVPPFHGEALRRHRAGNVPKWSPAMSLEDMDRAGVAVAITSIVNPGVWFGKVDEESRKLARACNEYAANLQRDYPTRFRFFAAIPLPDTEGSLREIEYSLDTLKAEGIALWTNYSDKYLGDPAFLPVFEELNRRRAVCYTHPTASNCCSIQIKGVQSGTVETATQTSYTVASLIFGEGGTVHKFPDIKWIWPHSGGTIPFLTSRFEQQTRVRPDPRMPKGPLPILERFYYDVAQGNTPGQLAALLKMAPVSQALFGSDYPFREAKEAVDGLIDYRFPSADLRAIDTANAQRLFPRIKV